MARIDWAMVCEHAFLDQHGRLCISSIVRNLPARLPVVVPRLMLVARLADIKPVDEVDIAVGIVTPSGLHAARPGSGGVSIEMAGEYVLTTLRDMPLIEEGLYRFQMRLRGQPIVSVEIPVVTAGVEWHASVQ